MIMKLGMEHYVLKLYEVYLIDDPELTLNHFKTMSNLANLFFELIVGPDTRSISGYIVMTDIKYRLSVICIATPFVVNSHVICWNNSLFQNTVCNYEQVPEETCAYVFHEEYVTEEFEPR